MKTHTVAIVVFVAAALAVAAYLAVNRTQSAATTAEAAGGPALPALRAGINDAAEVTIRRETGAFTFRRTESGWGLVEKSGYPANFENVRAMIIALADLELIEAKTSKPDLYTKINVHDVVAAAPTDSSAPPSDAAHAHIEVRSADGKQLGSIILGTQRWGASPEVFVRRAGEAQSWLARGRVDVPGDQLAWLDKTAINIPRERVRSVTLNHADGSSITVSKADAAQPSFLVQGIPDGRELTTPNAGDQLGNLLNFLSFDDVAPASTIDFASAAPGSRATVHLFDGLLVTITTALAGDKAWARIEAAYELPPTPTPTDPATDVQPDADSAAAEAARLEAETLNKKLAPWVFALPEHKLRVLQTTWDSLLKPLAPPAPAVAPTPAPNATGNEEE